MTEAYRLQDAANDLEAITYSLEDLLNLISLYIEFRDDELEGVDPKDPCTIGTPVKPSRHGSRPD